ncbi:permease [Saccharomonospora sp. CUA-673]|nr:permease [Saccharomonospora sp. CUA-673]
MPTWLRRTIIAIGLLGLWQAYVSLSGVSQFVFAGPWEVATALVSGWGSGEIARSTATTLEMLAISMVVGVAGAVVLSVLSVLTSFGNDLVSLMSSMINPLPSVAILPLAILWFGLTPTALIFVTTNAVLWPMTVNLSMGFRTVPKTIVMVGRNLGLSRWRLVRDILLPAALPHSLSGIRTAWAFGWRTIIAAELVFGVAGAQGGLGFFINEARYFARIPEVFAGLVTIALIGIALELLFSLLERRTVARWGMKEGTNL